MRGLIKICDQETGARYRRQVESTGAWKVGFQLVARNSVGKSASYAVKALSRRCGSALLRNYGRTCG